MVTVNTTHKTTLMNGVTPIIKYNHVNNYKTQ